MRLVKEKAWKYYNKWRKNPPYSPALKSKVRVSLKGWDHITGSTGHKKRAIGDVYRRLKLLPYADKIIKTSTTIQNIVEKKSRKFYAIEAMIEVKQDSKRVSRKVRVVIERDRNGGYVFLSVMDKKRR